MPAPATAVLVPSIVHYYSHNGGWFVGQAVGNARDAPRRPDEHRLVSVLVDVLPQYLRSGAGDSIL